MFNGWIEELSFQNGPIKKAFYLKYNKLIWLPLVLLFFLKDYLYRKWKTLKSLLKQTGTVSVFSKLSQCRADTFSAQSLWRLTDGIAANARCVFLKFLLIKICTFIAKKHLKKHEGKYHKIYNVPKWSRLLCSSNLKLWYVVKHREDTVESGKCVDVCTDGTLQQN